MTKYKIGILGCFYGKPHYVDACLSPWLAFKELNPNLKISIIHHAFHENFEQKPDTATFEKIKQHFKNIDFLFSEVEHGRFIGKNEADIRNMALAPLLKLDLDYIWLLDLDEFYTVHQISNILEYIPRGVPSTTYEINFKNYVYDQNHYILDFHPPRIFSKKGLEGFYWDNDVTYWGNISYKDLGICEIPRDVALIKHLSWLNEDGKNKVEYQLKHFGHCSFAWDEKMQRLTLDEQYYRRIGKSPPMIYNEN